MSPFGIYLCMGLLILLIERGLTYVFQKGGEPMEEAEDFVELLVTAPREFRPKLVVIVVVAYLTAFVVAWPYFCINRLYRAIKRRRG